MLQLKNFSAIVKNESLCNRMIVLILFIYPALLLTVKGSVGVLFGLLLIISAIQLYRMRKSPSVSHWDGVGVAFALAMASPVVAIFLSQAYHGDFKAPPYDWASRFLFAIPIFLVLRQTKIHTVSILQLALPLGALATYIALIQHPFVVYVDGQVRGMTTLQAFNLIHFSDSALMLGFLALFSINSEKKDHALILTLKLCAFIAGIYMSIQSGERGGWIAIPPLLLLWVITYHSKGKLRSTLGIATLSAIALICLSYYYIDHVQHRIYSAWNDLINFAHGNKDSPIGIRLQLWMAAIQIFMENPFFGVGPGGFAHAMPTLSATGVLTPVAANMGTAEVHNEILAKCAGTGLFGLASILSIYLVPLFIFLRATKSTLPPVKTAGVMGLCLVTGFFIFGLTAEIFNLRMTATFFSLTLAALMAASTHQPQK